jgi:hypothetical protein
MLAFCTVLVLLLAKVFLMLEKTGPAIYTFCRRMLVHHQIVVISDDQLTKHSLIVPAHSIQAHGMFHFH